ncbi:MAG TPA: hypothetical protein VNM48_15510, partial [Chloroflexota bacterium]|nr:hypothetical protein [Chloroflexota bacterium]
GPGPQPQPQPQPQAQAQPQQPQAQQPQAQPQQPQPQRGMSAYEQSLADAAATAAAGDAAKIAYQNAVLRGADDDRALRAAQQAWSQTFTEKQSTQAQDYQGKQFQFQQEQAAQAQAQQARQFQFQQEQNTQAQAQQARQNQFQQEQEANRVTQGNNQTALGVLNMNAGMAGKPSSYLSYLKTLGNTPQGLTSLVNGLAGRFNLASSQGSAPGSTYEPMSVATLMRDMNTTPAGGVPLDATNAVLPAGNQWNAKTVGILQKSPTQWGMLEGLYGQTGRDFQEEYAGFLSSLPKWGGPSRATIRV